MRSSVYESSGLELSALATAAGDDDDDVSDEIYGNDDVPNDDDNGDNGYNEGHDGNFSARILRS